MSETIPEKIERQNKTALLEMIFLRTLLASLEDLGIQEDVLEYTIRKYGEKILDLLTNDISLESMSDESFSDVYLNLLLKILENTLEAGNVEVCMDEKEIEIKIDRCPHHLGKNVRDILNIPPPSMCPVEVLINSILKGALLNPSIKERKVYRENDRYSCRMKFRVEG